MGVIFTDKEQNSISLMNVSYYDSIHEFMDSTGAGYSEKEALEDWEYMKNSGFIQEITCGTYNGATDDFTPWELTDDNNILDTIFNALHEEDFYEFVAMYEDPLTFDEWSKADWIREYTEVYEVFIIGDRVYVNQD